MNGSNLRRSIFNDFQNSDHGFEHGISLLDIEGDLDLSMENLAGLLLQPFHAVFEFSYGVRFSCEWMR